MADFAGTPVLHPMEWFAEEVIQESYGEDTEIIFLEFAVAMQALEKMKRLSKE